MQIPLGKIVLPGGSGLLGNILAPWLANRGWQVTILSRSPKPTANNIRTVTWNAHSLGPWTAELESAHALINLTGKSVDCRYTQKNRHEILNSRIQSTKILAQAIAQSQNPPQLWLNASTATIYQHAFTPQTELTGTIAPTPEAKDAFSLQVATQWEKALFDSPTPHTRKIALRTAIVLAANHHGAYTILRKLARFGLGGKIASGKQFVSWIHQDDFCRAIDFLLAHPTLAGPINLAAPNPLPNAQFMHHLRHSCHRTLGLPAPHLLLELATFLLRTESELVLKSRNVIPTRLLQENFRFLYPTLPVALAELESLTHPHPHPASHLTRPTVT